MTQTPHDQMSKQYLEEFLAPFGNVERQYEVPGEAKYVDVWFIPNETASLSLAELGLLGQMVQGMCLLEPYRNAPTRAEVRASLMKLLWIQEDEQRKAKQAERSLSEDALPKLWILAATVSEPVLRDVGGVMQADWLPGIYFMAEFLKAAIVSIGELPETEATLWLRILGRGSTQERAIREVLALPPNFPKRNIILRLLASWKIRIDLGELMDFAEQGEIMALSEAFLAWEQQKEHQTRQVIALNLLKQGIAIEAIAQATGLTIEELRQLQAEAN